MGCPSHLLWVPWIIQQIPTDCFTYGNIYVSVLLFFFKSLLNLLQYCFYFMFCFLSTGGIWNFSSSTRDRTCTPALEGKVLTTGLPGKLPPTPPQLLVVLKKLKIELPCNPEIPLLSIYPGKAIIPFLFLLFPPRLENSLRGLGLRMSLSSELIPR